MLSASTHRLLRLFPLSLGLALAALSLAIPAATAVDGRFAGQRLHLLNWSEYLDPRLVTAFEQQFGVELAQTYFETDEHRDRLLAENGAGGYDLAVIDESRLSLYRKLGWIVPLDPALLPGLATPIQRCRSAQPTSALDSMPYFWGTLGIVYRRDLVETPIKRWMQLYRPSESLRGRITMIDDAREVLGMAARALGHSMNSDDPEVWESASRLAKEQRPFVQTYGTLAIDESSSLLSGEVWAAQTYNGEAVALRALNPNIQFVHPEEGSSLWVDHWVLFADAPHRELAHAFLAFINDPKRAADNAETLYFATCNPAAESLLSEAFRADPIIYPPPEVLHRLEPYARLSPRILSQINTHYSHIKAHP